MPAQSPFDLGDPVPLSIPVTDTAGNPQNTNGTVTLTITQPDQTTQVFSGTPTSAQITNPSVGIYQLAGGFPAVQAGHHLVAWTVTGTFPGGFNDTFEVWPAQDPTILSLAEAKEILRIPTTNTQYDGIVRGYNRAISEWVEYVCGPVVVQTITEVLPADYMVVALSKPPVISLTNWTTTPSFLAGSGIPVPSPPSPMYPMRIYGITYPGTALSLDPARGTVRHQAGLPFIFGEYVWQYQAGRPVIPYGIYEANKIALKHLFAVERGGMAGGGQANYGMTETSAQATGFGFSVPNRAVELLTPYSAAQRAAMA